MTLPGARALAGLALSLPRCRALARSLGLAGGAGDRASSVLEIVRRAGKIALELHVAACPGQLLTELPERILRPDRIAACKRLRRVVHRALGAGAGLASHALERCQR